MILCKTVKVDNSIFYIYIEYVSNFQVHNLLHWHPGYDV